MTSRITVTTGTVSGLAAPSGPRVGRYFITGQTQKGSVSPTVVRSMADYVALFGARSGGANMYDAAEFYLGAGVGELVVCRAYGADPVNSTISLDTDKITVTAKNPGAFYDAYTAAYTSATKTLTIVKGATTVTYTGTDADSLEQAAAIDPDVTVTVSALPASNVSATALASGDDDFANVAWATVLAATTSMGPGAIAAPGVPGAASALAAHAESTDQRLALLSVAEGDSVYTVTTAQGNVTAANKPFASYVNGWGRVANGTGGLKMLDPVTYAAAVRAAAINTLGVGVSALSRDAHALVGGFTPVAEPSSDDFAALLAAGVITVRTLSSGVGIDVWSLADGVGGNADLTGAQFRDLASAIIDEASSVLDRYVGQAATPLLLALAAADIAAQLEPYSAFLAADDGPNGHPGYRVTVSNGADLADNRISAIVAVRFAENVEFVDLTVNTAAADQAI